MTQTPLLGYSEETELVRKSISELAAKFDTSYWVSNDKAKRFPSEFWDALAAEGWFGLNIPVENGGVGYGMFELSVALKEIAASGAGIAGANQLLIMASLVTEPIKLGGSKELKEKYLPEIAKGKLKGCFALTEPGAGVNTFNISTYARKEGDEYVINGQKVWTTLAHVADLMVLVARTTPKGKTPKKSYGLTIFLVDLREQAAKQSVRIVPIDKLSFVCLGSNEVFINDLRVPEENVIGEPDKGWEYLARVLNAERICTASMCAGTGEYVLKKAVEYAKQRVVFNDPIGKYQGIQFPLAVCKAELEAAWLMTQKSAKLYDMGESKKLADYANMSAFLAARAAFNAADRALQTYGGMGFSKDNDIERHWRDLRLFRTAPIPEEMALNYIAQHILGLPRSY